MLNERKQSTAQILRAKRDGKIKIKNKGLKSNSIKGTKSETGRD